MKAYKPSGLKKGELLLYNDLMDFLKMRNLTGFCGFDVVANDFEVFFIKHIVSQK
jgi:hypothetical protein